MLVMNSVCTFAAAEVVDVATTGFQVRYTQLVSARPEKVWQSFVAVDRWWSGDHTYSGKSSNLRIEPRPGGCFCETLPNGGGVVHLTVVNVQPNRSMVFAGGLGPLQTSGVAGSMNFQIKPEGESSRVTLIYTVGGYQPGGFAALAPVVDQVLGAQFTRLTRLIDTGDAEPKK